MTEFLEVAIPEADEKPIRKIWRKLGCRCLRKAWAEPWSDRGIWYSYHFMACPVTEQMLLSYN